MYPVFAVLLLALAGCTVLVVRRRGPAISEEALGYAVIGAADDPMVVFNVTDQVRETIQHTLYELLMQRRSAFF